MAVSLAIEPFTAFQLSAFILLLDTFRGRKIEANVWPLWDSSMDCQ